MLRKQHVPICFFAVYILKTYFCKYQVIKTLNAMYTSQGVRQGLDRLKFKNIDYAGYATSA